MLGADTARLQILSIVINGQRPRPLNNKEQVQSNEIIVFPGCAELIVPCGRHYLTPRNAVDPRGHKIKAKRSLSDQPVIGR